MARIVTATEMEEGEGAVVKRLFPSGSFRDLDPFILFDEFFVDPDAGFPEHPHRGFEALTYMLDGAFRHSDNQGNDFVVHRYGAQRFSAGKGIIHSEMPGNPSGISHGIQLWINLPRNQKTMDPDYQNLESDSFPYNEVAPGISMRTIAGKGSPLNLHTPVLYYHFQFSKKARYDIALQPDYTGIVYVYKGRVDGDYRATEGQAIIPDSGEPVRIEAQEGTGMLFISGLPYGEQIIHRGSFVD